MVVLLRLSLNLQSALLLSCTVGLLNAMEGEGLQQQDLGAQEEVEGVPNLGMLLNMMGE